MLPEIRTREFLYSVPKFTIAKDDVKDLAQELKGFHEAFSDCFHRSESKGHFFACIVFSNPLDLELPLVEANPMSNF